MQVRPSLRKAGRMQTPLWPGRTKSEHLIPPPLVVEVTSEAGEAVLKEAETSSVVDEGLRNEAGEEAVLLAPVILLDTWAELVVQEDSHQLHRTKLFGCK